ncbi:MAG TPA: hypothetical protein VET24_11350, partial [Actinomycetota bacterium]|nr:hypothetical protein [Actinomycetota bacterium]
MVGTVSVADWAFYVRAAKAQDLQRRLYEDKEQFNQLSGAARSLLERRYGKRQDKEWLRSQPQPERLDQGAVKLAPANPWESRDFSGLEEPLSPVANTLVNNPAADTSAQDTQSETSIVLGAGSTVVVGFNDTRLLNPSACLTGDSSGCKSTGFSQSTDGGNFFTDRGALPTNPLGDSGDPVLARDSVSGTIYLSTLAGVEDVSAIPVFRSFDNGATFTAPVNGAPGFGGGDFLDKDWITVDNFPGPGQGTAYLVFRNFDGGGTGSRPGGVYLLRSTDGGATWTPSGGLSLTSALFTQGQFV